MSVRGLSRQQLAARVGYANTNKGARRIEAIEAGRGDDAGVAGKIIEALAITEAAAGEAVRLDEHERRQRYLKTISTPIDPVLTVRLMPAVYARHRLPDGLRDHIELETIACGVARDMDKYVHLVLPSRTSLWINPDGEVYARSEPDDEGLPVTPGTRIGRKPLPGLVTRSILGENASDP